LSIIWAAIAAFAFLTSSNKYGAGDRKRDAVSLRCVEVLDGQETDWSSVPAEKIEAAITATASPGNAAQQSATAVQSPAAPSTVGWGPVVSSAPDSAELLLMARAAQSDPPNDAKKFITSCLEAKQHDYESDVVRQRDTAMIAALGIMAVPPLLLLILGFLVSWIVAGFRKPRSDP
jgi:hypothetical protein